MSTNWTRCAGQPQQYSRGIPGNSHQLGQGLFLFHASKPGGRQLLIYHRSPAQICSRIQLHSSMHMDGVKKKLFTSTHRCHVEHISVAKPKRPGNSKKQLKDTLPNICWSPISAANMLLDQQTNSWIRSFYRQGGLCEPEEPQTDGPAV